MLIRFLSKILFEKKLLLNLLRRINNVQFITLLFSCFKLLSCEQNNYWPYVLPNVCGSSHIPSVLIDVEYRNFHRTLDVYLLPLFQLIILIQSDRQRVYFLNKSHFNLFDLKWGLMIYSTGKLKKVDKHKDSKFDENFEVQH